MWELDHKEGWMLKNWCFWTVVLEKTLESPLDCKEIQPVNPKGNLPWIFIGRIDAEAEIPVLWPSDVKIWLIGKDPSAGKDWRHKEKGMTEDEMVRWHLWLNGHEFEQTLGDGEGQGSQVCYNLWGHKESDTSDWTITEQYDYIILFNFIYLFIIFGCAGSSLLHGLFSSCGEQRVGLVLVHRRLIVLSCCGAQARGHEGFSSCGMWAQ